MTRLKEYAGAASSSRNLTLRELRGRYKRSVLGWTLVAAQPAGDVAIYSLVFGFFLKIEPPDRRPERAAQLRAVPPVRAAPVELLPERARHGSLGSLVGNGNLIKKVYFPRELLVASTSASLDRSTFCIELGVLGVILLLVGNMVLPWIPVAARAGGASRPCSCSGCALMLSVFNVYFRDVKHFVGIALQVLFYTAPIVYPISVVPEARGRSLGVDIPCCASTSSTRSSRSSSATATCCTTCASRRSADFVYIIVWAVGAAARRLVGLRASSSRAWPRKCDGTRRSSSTTSRSGSASTTSATSR